MKIKAALVRGKGQPYHITDLELAEVQAKDVLVKIVASGICRSDYAERNGNSLAFPNVLGHEGSGIVEKVGSGVSSVEPGDHVILSYAYCGDCKPCSCGHPSSCIDWLGINNSGTNSRGEYTLHTEAGANVNSFFNQSSFSTHSLVDESNIVKVDKDVDLRLLGPLSCGLATGSGAVFSVLNPQACSSLAVFGTGAVGFAAIMAAKLCGCYPIIAIDINEKRLDMARKIGATHVLNSSCSCAKDFILSLTDDLGADYVIDTTGIPKVMTECLQSLMNCGTFLPLAVTKKNFELNTFFDLVFGNKNIKGVLIGDTIPKFHLPKLINFYKQGDFPFDQFIRFYNFQDINQAEADLISGDVIKAVLVIDKEYQPPEF